MTTTVEVVTTTHLAVCKETSSHVGEGKGGEHGEHGEEEEEEGSPYSSGPIPTMPAVVTVGSGYTPTVAAAPEGTVPTGGPSNGTKPTGASASAAIFKGVAFRTKPDAVLAFSVCFGLAMLGWVRLI